jgi:hypothetical protein
MLILGTTLIALGGCANSYTWVKPGASVADFYSAKSYCDAISTGATPMDYSNPGSSSTYHSGSVYGSGGGYGTYSGTSTTYYDNSAQTIANLGQTFQRQQIFNDCMRGRGFVPQQVKSSRPTDRSKHAGSPQSGNNPPKSNELKWEESAVDNYSATVIFDNIKLLSQPNFDAKQLDNIAKGEKIEIVAEAESFWFKVRYKWQEGYVLQPWVTATP